MSECHFASLLKLMHWFHGLPFSARKEMIQFAGQLPTKPADVDKMCKHFEDAFFAEFGFHLSPPLYRFLRQTRHRIIKWETEREKKCKDFASTLERFYNAVTDNGPKTYVTDKPPTKTLLDAFVESHKTIRAAGIEADKETANEDRGNDVWGEDDLFDALNENPNLAHQGPNFGTQRNVVRNYIEDALPRLVDFETLFKTKEDLMHTVQDKLIEKDIPLPDVTSVPFDLLPYVEEPLPLVQKKRKRAETDTSSSRKRPVRNQSRKCHVCSTVETGTWYYEDKVKLVFEKRSPGEKLFCEECVRDL